MRLERREHHGVTLPVPWVTLWSDEEEAKPAFLPYRTKFGTVTIRVEPTLIGKGEVEWARVHAGRAFHSARRGNCQVCGEVNERWYRFGSGPEFAGFDQRPGNMIAVTEPVTCAACIPKAEKLCPSVRDEGPWDWWLCESLGIMGGMFGPREGRDAVPVMLSSGEQPRPGWVMKQPFTGVVLVRPLRTTDNKEQA